MQNKILTFPGSPRKNDALFLYGARQHHPFVLAYSQEETEIVYGPACKPDKEIQIEQCATEGVPVVARRGGGGTVVLSPGVVVTIIVGKRAGDQGPSSIFSQIHDAFISLFSQPGSIIEKKGLSDLAIHNKKILGSSLYLQNNPPFFYYQSSLLVNPDLSLMDRYLRHPPKEPDYRKGRAHEKFCTTLQRCEIHETPERIADRINRDLSEKLKRPLDYTGE